MNQGVQALLTRPIVDSTSALSSLYSSQVALSEQLELLTANLVQYDSESVPLDMTPTLRRLKDTKARLEKVRDTVKVIEARLLGVRKEIIQKGVNTRSR